MSKTLLEQIEDDALDSKKSVADALRKCIALGGRAGNEELREWASRELQGYEQPDDVPDYRIVAAPIVIDGVGRRTESKPMCTRPCAPALIVTVGTTPQSRYGSVPRVDWMEI